MNTTVSEWFRDNFIAFIALKCHLLVSEYKYELMFATVGDALLWEKVSVEFLGIIINSSLTFDDHGKKICKKYSQKLTGAFSIAYSDYSSNL